MVEAFAYIDRNGLINVRTVTSTEVAAMVNAIVILTDWRIIPRESWSNEIIIDKFKHIAKLDGGRIAVVKITLEESQ